MHFHAFRIGQSQRQVRCRQRPKLAQQVGHAFHAVGPARRFQPLQFTFNLSDHPCIQQFAQVYLAQQLGKQATVQ
ncbi:hypothetical protein D3C75_1260820 [compost metagenome]